MKNKKQKILRYVCLFFLTLVAVFFIGAVAYINDYYRADKEALSALASNEFYTVRQEKKGTVYFEPDVPEYGFIFYPGGKVENTAYANLCGELAKKKILCVLLKVPCNLAMFDVDAAAGIKEKYPDIKEWYIGGHSLGGATAAMYVEKNPDEYNGIIFLAAYSTKDLSNTGMKVLSVYGSEDGVLNMEKYNKYIDNLPEDYTEYIIDGGCHGFFGNYGMQDGDGTPSITNKEQIEITVEQIISFFN